MTHHHLVASTVLKLCLISLMYSWFEASLLQPEQTELSKSSTQTEKATPEWKYELVYYKLLQKLDDWAKHGSGQLID